MMRLTALVLAVMFVMMSLVMIPVYAEGNPIDKAGDWFATRGKQEPEKSMILAQRQAAREAKKAQKAMEKQSKQMEKNMNKAFGK